MFNEVASSLVNVDSNVPDKYSNALTNTPSYEKQKLRDYNKLLTFISENNRLQHLLMPISEEDDRSRFSLLFNEAGNMHKKNLFNSIMKKFAYHVAKEKNFQPSTINVMFKRIFSKLKDNFNIPWNFQDDFNGNGEFGSLLVTVYREKGKADVNYGNQPTKYNIAEEDREKMDGKNLGAIFSEDNPKTFIMKVLFILGRYNGLHGRSEHTQLHKMNYIEGNYPSGHPLHNVAVCWVEIMPSLSKTVKITLTNYYKESDFANRIPVYSYEDKSDIGGTIWRFRHSMHPEQERFYCYGATSRQKSNFVKEGFLNVKFSPKRAIGENTLAKYFKEGAKMLGIQNYENFQPHSLRNLFVTVVSNNAGKAGLNLQSQMKMTRHCLVSAHNGYIEECAEDEMKRIYANGLVKNDILVVKQVPAPNVPTIDTEFDVKKLNPEFEEKNKKN